MGTTSIEWTEFSVNPFRARLPGRGTKGGYNSGVGHYCEKISAGCTNCYSSATQPRFGLPQFQKQRTAGIEHFLDPSKLLDVLKRKAPTKFFWCDMTDMFGSWVPFDWIAACFGVMAATPQHTHQVLTKRPVRALEFFRWVDAHGNHPREVIGAKAQNLVGGPMEGGADVPGGGWPLHQVHLGVSCEDQKAADERIPLLLQCPAAVRWVSAEPLLGDTSLWAFLKGETRDECLRKLSEKRDMPGLDWVVVGSESGPGARPMDIAWAESLRDQCGTAGVPFFTKQIANSFDRKGGDPTFWPAGPWPRQFPG